MLADWAVSGRIEAGQTKTLGPWDYLRVSLIIHSPGNDATVGNHGLQS